MHTTIAFAHPDTQAVLTWLILILFGLLLWQMQQQDWGSFFLILAAEAGLVAIKITSKSNSKRI